MDVDLYEVLLQIKRNLDRIASALESYNNAAIRGIKPDESDGHIEIFASTWARPSRFE